MSIPFHFPPELTLLLIDTIPLLCRSKRDVILFFHGAGVAERLTSDLSRKIEADKGSVTKYEIVRTILTRLNQDDDANLRERREALKRIIEWEDFSTCWPDDQLKAKGLVAEIRRVVNVKDSFTRINQEREKETHRRMAEKEADAEAKRQKQAIIAAIRTDLCGLFAETNAHKRGKALEGILNRLFAAFGILVREAFTLRGNSGEGIVEQIDGVVEVEGH
jgi:restriction system protein